MTDFMFASFGNSTIPSDTGTEMERIYSSGQDLKIIHLIRRHCTLIAGANFSSPLGVLRAEGGKSGVSAVSTICLLAAMAGLFITTGVSNAMKRLVYNRSGKSFRRMSRQLVRDYRALYGQDRNYWAYCSSWLAFSLGIAGFALFPK